MTQETKSCDDEICATFPLHNNTLLCGKNQRDKHPFPPYFGSFLYAHDPEKDSVKIEEWQRIEKVMRDEIDTKFGELKEATAELEEAIEMSSDGKTEVLKNLKNNIVSIINNICNDSFCINLKNTASLQYGDDGKIHASLDHEAFVPARHGAATGEITHYTATTTTVIEKPDKYNLFVELDRIYYITQEEAAAIFIEVFKRPTETCLYRLRPRC
jgi:hypothetical protein